MSKMRGLTMTNIKKKRKKKLFHHSMSMRLGSDTSYLIYEMSIALNKYPEFKSAYMKEHRMTCQEIVYDNADLLAELIILTGVSCVTRDDKVFVFGRKQAVDNVLFVLNYYRLSDAALVRSKNSLTRGMTTHRPRANSKMRPLYDEAHKLFVGDPSHKIAELFPVLRDWDYQGPEEIMLKQNHSGLELLGLHLPE